MPLNQWQKLEKSSSRIPTKLENKATTEEVIRMVQYFPRFTNEKDNIMLMEKVTLEELKVVLNSFQKDKSPRTRWMDN
jgi:hypothetical protein